MECEVVGRNPPSRTHSTPLCPLVTTKHLTLTLTLKLNPKLQNANPTLTLIITSEAGADQEEVASQLQEQLPLIPHLTLNSSELSFMGVIIRLRPNR